MEAGKVLFAQLITSTFTTLAWAETIEHFFLSFDTFHVTLSLNTAGSD